MGTITTMIAFEFYTLLYLCLFTSLLFLSFFFVLSFKKKYLLIILGGGILWLVSSFFFMSKLAEVPQISSFHPFEEQATTNSSIIRLTFRTPVNFQTLKINSFPSLDFSIVNHGYLGNFFSIGRTVSIIPQTTLPPGQDVMLYISDITGPFTHGYGGEQLLEFKIPEPNIVSVDPKNESIDIPSTQSFTFTVDHPIEFVSDWEIQSTPNHSFILEQLEERKIKISPTIPLRPGIKYVLTLIHKPIIRKKNNGEIVKKIEEKVKGTLTFTTSKPAFINNFEPLGENVLENQPMIVQFDQPMDTLSVKEHLFIKPDISFSYEWNDDNSKVEIKHEPFKKDTTYTTTFSKGLQTQNGKVFERDVIFQFKTVGPLAVTKTDPTNQSPDVSVNNNITLHFNQPISEELIKKIIVDPPIAATASFSSQMIELILTQPMAFNTKYTVTIPKGTESQYGLPSTQDYLFSFETSPDEVSLPVPFYKQQQSFTCNIAAAKMLLAYRGIFVDEQTLINHIGIGGKRGSGNPFKGYVDDYGTYWDALEKGVAPYRKYRRIIDGKLPDIINEIKKGNPVMIWGQNGWSDPHDLSWTTADGIFIKAVNGMHSSVVRGFRGSEENPTHILLNDPWRGRYAIETNEFLRRWNYFNVALVVE